MKTSVVISIIAAAFISNIGTAYAAERIEKPGLSEHHNNYSELMEVLHADDVEMTEISYLMLDPASFEAEYEEMVEIESWMFDETHFEDKEAFVEIEEWMFDETLFEDEEAFIEIEEWMFDVDRFAVK
ncbi:MAG: hypothetical protein R6U46_08330 [Marinilabilia sp.]